MDRPRAESSIVRSEKERYRMLAAARSPTRTPADRDRSLRVQGRGRGGGSNASVGRDAEQAGGSRKPVWLQLVRQCALAPRALLECPPRLCGQLPCHRCSPPHTPAGSHSHVLSCMAGVGGLEGQGIARHVHVGSLDVHIAAAVHHDACGPAGSKQHASAQPATARTGQHRQCVFRKQLYAPLDPCRAGLLASSLVLLCVLRPLPSVNRMLRSPCTVTPCTATLLLPYTFSAVYTGSAPGSGHVAKQAVP